MVSWSKGIDTIDLTYYTVADGDRQTQAAREAEWSGGTPGAPRCFLTTGAVLAVTLAALLVWVPRGAWTETGYFLARWLYPEGVVSILWRSLVAFGGTKYSLAWGSLVTRAFAADGCGIWSAPARRVAGKLDAWPPAVRTLREEVRYCPTFQGTAIWRIVIVGERRINLLDWSHAAVPCVPLPTASCGAVSPPYRPGL